MDDVVPDRVQAFLDDYAHWQPDICIEWQLVKRSCFPP